MLEVCTERVPQIMDFGSLKGVRVVIFSLYHASYTVNSMTELSCKIPVDVKQQGMACRLSDNALHFS